jgi:5-methylcytosine-specific restriction endonuclease McrA
LRSITIATLAAAILVAVAVPSPTAARTYRSMTQRHAFIVEHPCPSTGHTRGACPGWEVDHVTPLKCGGTDKSGNMQWLTAQDHKAKTKREAKRCRR